jgi:glycosyltransferase involved in cell wall biosynthesis
MHDILLISDDVAGEKMAGPGIRAWEVSRRLAKHFRVALAVPDYSPRSGDPDFYRRLPFELHAYSVTEPERLLELARGSKIVITQGYVLSKFPGLKALDVHLICDLYVPFPLENLFVHKWKVPNLKDREFIHLNDLRVFNDQVMAGDHFLCASERQRDLFTGALLSLDRINPEVLDLCPDLEDLISVVHFGITEDEAEPLATGPRERVIRGVLPGVKDTDILFFWGGVITNWYDPATMLRAFARAQEKNPALKLFFIAKRHPNPLLPEFDLANEAVKLSGELGLLGRSVFFNENWIDYERKGLYFQEADIGISIHKTHFETYYSFRIRLLDYLKYELPILCTDGDYFADLVRKEGLGLTVASGAEEDLVRAMLELAGDPEMRRAIKMRLSEVKKRFTWDRVTEPLVAHCRKVLAGGAAKIRRPGRAEIARICSLEAEGPARQAGRELFWPFLHRLPFGMMTRIKRLLSRVR